MFDPTIFENVKIALEGAVYELDLRGDILVTGRSNRIELAEMSRCCALRFCLSSHPPDRAADGRTAGKWQTAEEANHAAPGRVMAEAQIPEAEVRLWASTMDLASEISGSGEHTPGCRLELAFHVRIADPLAGCTAIRKVVAEIWGEHYLINQIVFFSMEPSIESPVYGSETVLDFNRSFDEQVIADIPRLAEHMELTLRQLREVQAERT